MCIYAYAFVYVVSVELVRLPRALQWLALVPFHGVPAGLSRLWSAEGREHERLKGEVGVQIIADYLDRAESLGIGVSLVSKLIGLVDQLVVLRMEGELGMGGGGGGEEVEEEEEGEEVEEEEEGE